MQKLKPEPETKKNPFLLKKRGELEPALNGYAERLAQAAKEGNTFMAEVCFDQMFDIELLRYSKSGSRFSNLADLKARLKADLTSQCPDLDYYYQRGLIDLTFEHFFASSWRKYTYRGKVKRPFSVPAHLLVAQSKGGKKPHD